MKEQNNVGIAAGCAKTRVRGGIIAFRLDDDNYAKLSKRAEALGVSLRVLARRWVAEMLGENEERTALREAINALGDQVGAARKDIALAAEVLLHATGSIDAKAAREWSQKNLMRE